LIVSGGALARRQNSNPAAVAEWLETQNALVAWFAERAPAMRRVCSFLHRNLLARLARQLIGRTATTHWAAAKLLTEQPSRIRVEATAFSFATARSGLRAA